MKWANRYDARHWLHVFFIAYAVAHVEHRKRFSPDKSFCHLASLSRYLDFATVSNSMDTHPTLVATTDATPELPVELPAILAQARAQDMRPGAYIIVGKPSKSSSTLSSASSSAASSSPAMHSDATTTHLPATSVLGKARVSTRPMPTGPLQLPATVFVNATTKTGERAIVIGQFRWADDRYGRSTFDYRGKKCNSAYIFDFGELGIFPRATKVYQKLRQEETGKGWTAIGVLNSRKSPSPASSSDVGSGSGSTSTNNNSSGSESTANTGSASSKESKKPHEPRPFSLEDYKSTHGFLNDPSTTRAEREQWCRRTRAYYLRPRFVTLLDEVDQELDQAATKPIKDKTRSSRNDLVRKRPGRVFVQRKASCSSSPQQQPQPLSQTISTHATLANASTPPPPPLIPQPPAPSKEQGQTAMDTSGEAPSESARALTTTTSSNSSPLTSATNASSDFCLQDAIGKAVWMVVIASSIDKVWTNKKKEYVAHSLRVAEHCESLVHRAGFYTQLSDATNMHALSVAALLIQMRTFRVCKDEKSLFQAAQNYSRQLLQETPPGEAPICPLQPLPLTMMPNNLSSEISTASSMMVE